MGGTKSSSTARAPGPSEPVEERYERVPVQFPALSRPTLPILRIRYQDRLLELNDERSEGNGFFLDLQDNWRIDRGGASSGAFDTLKDVEEALRNSVRRVRS